jgi:hypothetical protein
MASTTCEREIHEIESRFLPRERERWSITGGLADRFLNPNARDWLQLGYSNGSYPQKHRRVQSSDKPSRARV